MEDIMLIAIKNPAIEVSDILKNELKSYIGDNFYVDINDTIALFPAVRVLYLGGVLTDGTLEGSESAMNISLQTESFATGQGVEAQKKVWELDDIVHQILVNLCFRRSYNSLVETTNSNVKRVVSRYSRIYTGQL